MDTVWVITAEEVGNRERIYGPFVFKNRLPDRDMRKLAYWLTNEYGFENVEGGSFDSGVYLIESPRFVFTSFDEMEEHFKSLERNKDVYS